MIRRGSAGELVDAVVAERLGVGCRDWPGALTSEGRPAMRDVGRRWRLVSHVVLERLGEPRPDDGRALHTCDRPVCFAPWHLRWGTQAENLRDASDRGRLLFGEANPSARLTAADVAWIRSCHLPATVCAKLLGVGRSTVSDARRGVTWRRATVPAAVAVAH